MSEIKINIDDQYLQSFLEFLKTLNYIEVEKVTQNKTIVIAQSTIVNNAFPGGLPPDSPLKQAVKPIRKKVSVEELIKESGDLKTDLDKLRQLAKELDIPQSTGELLEQLTT